MINLSGIYKKYGFNEVLEDFSMTVHLGEKIGLIGANGSGKSTVFKLLAGLESPDKGGVALGQKLSIGYMDQVGDYEEGAKVEESLLKVFSHLLKIEERMRELEVLMSSDGSSKKIDSYMKEYARISSRYENEGGYLYKTRIKEILEGLGLVEFKDELISSLSGGEQSRVQIGELLLSRPDILLLDEPTNHLDFLALNWLEDYIKNYRGTVLIISHDRYFLDSTIDRIVEIKSGRAHHYVGNYSFYLKERKRRYEEELKRYKDQQKEIKKREEAIKRLKRWGDENDNEKFHKRAKSMEKQLEKVERVDNPDLGDSQFNLNFGADRSGKDVLSLEGVSKFFEERLILEDINLKVFYGDRIGLVGPNGSGKSTLLKMILGSEGDYDGKIKLGASLEMGYLSQHQELEDGNLTLLESFRKDMPPMEESRARGVLARYGFKGDEVFKYIKELSGGERVRFHLMKMVHSQINLLILDEPTNHLDLKSIEILEETLKDYQGTLILVSHDRYFLNKVINKIYAIEDKRLVYYDGNYNYYRQKVKEREEREQVRKRNKKSNRKELKEEKASEKSKKDLAKRLEEIEEKIVRLEEKREENNLAMTDKDNIDDYEYLNELKVENERIEEELKILVGEWEEIVELSIDN